MKLTSKFQKVKLGCGLTISARVNEYGVLNIRIPNFRQTIRVIGNYGEDAVMIVSPDSIAGLERLLKAFKAASKYAKES